MAHGSLTASRRTRPIEDPWDGQFAGEAVKQGTDIIYWQAVVHVAQRKRGSTAGLWRFSWGLRRPVMSPAAGSAFGMASSVASAVVWKSGDVQAFATKDSG